MAIVIESITTSTATGSSITIDMPTVRPDGDLYLVFIARRDDVNINGPSGWNLIHDEYGDDNIDQAGAVYWIIGDNLPATISASGDNEPWNAAVVRISGADTDSPINAENSNTGGGGAAITAPAVTPSVDDGLIFRWGSAQWSGSPSEPGGHTEQVDSSNSSSRLYVVTRNALSEDGVSTGTASFGSSNGNSASCRGTIVVAPGTGGEPVEISARSSTGSRAEAAISVAPSLAGVSRTPSRADAQLDTAVAVGASSTTDSRADATPETGVTLALRSSTGSRAEAAIASEASLAARSATASRADASIATAVSLSARSATGSRASAEIGTSSITRLELRSATPSWADADLDTRIATAARSATDSRSVAAASVLVGLLARSATSGRADVAILTLVALSVRSATASRATAAMSGEAVDYRGRIATRTASSGIATRTAAATTTTRTASSGIATRTAAATTTTRTASPGITTRVE